MDSEWTKESVERREKKCFESGSMGAITCSKMGAGMGVGVGIVGMGMGREIPTPEREFWTGMLKSTVRTGTGK